MGANSGLTLWTSVSVSLPDETYVADRIMHKFTQVGNLEFKRIVLFGFATLVYENTMCFDILCFIDGQRET